MSKFVQTIFTLFLMQKLTTFINATSLQVNLELTLLQSYYLNSAVQAGLFGQHWFAGKSEGYRGISKFEAFSIIGFTILQACKMNL